MKHWTSESMTIQWVDDSVNQGTNESMNQWSMKQRAMNQRTNDSMNRWANESVNPWISTNQLVNAWMDGWMDGMEQSRAEWSGVAWGGVAWSGVAWRGVAWGGVEWSEWAGKWVSELLLCWFFFIEGPRWGTSFVRYFFSEQPLIWPTCSELPSSYLFCSVCNAMLLFAQLLHCV